MDIQTAPVWQGPTAVPEGVTVVASADAWERVRATWTEPLRARVDARPDWRRDVIVVIAGARTGDLSLALRAAFHRTGAAMAIDVTAESHAGAAAVPSAMNNPTLIVSAPADAFAGDPTPALSWNGKEWTAPFRYER
jgi:hypothetical protein